MYLSYSEFMPRLRSIVPRDLLKDFSCVDQGLLAHLTKEGTKAREKVISHSKNSFYSYCSKSNPRTVHSLAKDIIDDCAPTYFVDFLNSVDDMEDLDGVISERILEGFKDIIPELTESSATESLGRYFYNVIRTEANVLIQDVSGSDKEEEPQGKSQECNSADWALNELKEKIDNHKPLYVQTGVFQKALQTIKNCRRVLIVGDPGAGKSITSEMIADDFLTNGYEVKYSVQTDNLTSIIADITSNPDAKQLVFVDDCFGQIVMDLCSEQESDLRKLAIIIRQNKNKYLLLNSRIAIMQMVLFSEKPLKSIINDFRNENSIISIKNLTDLEKAKILYNHLLLMPGVTNEHYQNIRDKNRYFDIIHHDNFTPRIIEHVTQSFFLAQLKPDEYYSRIIETLDDPEIIWDWEYNKRLTLSQRVLLTTLYSLTNKTCDVNTLKTAFLKRIQFEPMIDKTKDNWREAVSVLNGAMIKIYAWYGNKRNVEVINPSVNDYLSNNVIIKGSPEEAMIIKAAVFPNQIMRMCGDDASSVFRKKLLDGSINELVFDSQAQKELVISYYLAVNGICQDEYKQVVSSFISNLEQFGAYYSIKKTDVICNLIKNKASYDFYLGNIDFGVLFARLCKTFNLVSVCSVIMAVSRYYPMLYRFFDKTNIGNFEMLMADLVLKSFSDVCYDHLPNLIDEDPSGDVLSINRQLNHEIRKDLHELFADDIPSFYYLPLMAKRIINDLIDKSFVDFSEEIKIEIGSRENQEDSDDTEDKPYNSMIQILKLFMKKTIK